ALPDALSLGKDAAFQALDLLGQAIERDPRYGPALALAAWWNLQIVDSGWADDSEVNTHKAVNLAWQALQVAGDDPVALADAAGVLGSFGEDINAAIGLIDRSLALNPSSALAWNYSGWLRLVAGQPNLAIEHLRNSLRLDPRSPTLRPYYLTGIGIAHFSKQQFEQAASFFRASLQQAPWFVTYRYLASCYAHMGRLHDAREIVKRLEAITPAVAPSGPI